MNDPYIFLLTLALCLVLSFLFSGMETGVFAVSRLRIRQQMKAGRKQARVLHQYLQDLESFLWTILTGNALANFVATVLIVGAVGVALKERPWLVLLVNMFLIFLFYTFCDLLPKMLFRTFPNRLCMAAAIPFRFISIVFAPLVWVVERFSELFLAVTGGTAYTGHLFGTRTELRHVMRESAQVFTTEERAMITRALNLQDYTARSVMTPISRLAAVTAETPARELLAMFRRQHVSRLPVWGGQGANRRIIGIVSLDHLIFAGDFHPERPAGDFVTPALYVSEGLVLDEALKRMQGSGQRMAVVLSHDQRELGIITVQDIMKVIFGEVTL